MFSLIINLLKPSGSQKGKFYPREHSAMSGDTSDCHNWCELLASSG